MCVLKSSIYIYTFRWIKERGYRQQSIHNIQIQEGFLQPNDIIRVIFQEHRMAEVVLPVSEEPVFFVTLCRLRTDSATFSTRGGKLTSSVDFRVCLHVPKNAFRLSNTLSMKVRIGLLSFVVFNVRYNSKWVIRVRGQYPYLMIRNTNLPLNDLRNSKYLTIFDLQISVYTYFSIVY